MSLSHRSVDPAKMQTVEAMIKAPDHREKMPHIIKTILEFAYLTYSGKATVDISIIFSFF